MFTLSSPLSISALVIGISAAAALFFMRPARWSWRTFLAAILPSLLMLTLFCSLAIHIHGSLGGWPESIGECGFPRNLVVHAHVTMGYFMFLVLSGLFVWPAAFLVCLAIRRWRSALFHLGVHALAFFACLGAMQLAPPLFLNWWWD
ncbi:MAG: hypothetical protein IAE97_09880 [Chthoniobacterales bacterium]|nr:hypothetical protein [Chthoniobacterales bacterium]